MQFTSHSAQDGVKASRAANQKQPWLVNGVPFSTIDAAREYADLLERWGIPVDFRFGKEKPI